MNELQTLWSKITEHFEQTMAQTSYKYWVSNVIPLQLQNNELSIEVPTELHKTYWEEQLVSDIIPITYAYLRSPLSLVFYIHGQGTAETHAPYNYGQETPNTSSRPNAYSEQNISSTPSRSSEDDSKLNPKYTFDTFIIGKGSQMAHAAALVVSETPGVVYNPLFFYGGVGLGKTHLMQAIGNHYKALNPQARVQYVTSETFTNDLIKSISNNSQEELREKYRKVDLLLVDDIQFFANKEATQEEFFHTFNELYLNGKQIVLTSDRQPTEIKSLQERLVSRFVSGLPVDITPPDLETRIAILSKKAEAIGIDITSETLSYIAGQIDSNVRELEGALVRVQAYSVTQGEDISTNLAADALKSYLPNNKARIISIYDIQQEVAKHYGITIEDLKGKKRTKQIVEPRQIAMYLSRELTNVSLPKIGFEFGGKDHSTVIHAYDKIAESIKEDQAILDATQALIKKLSH
ncbi:chromosomal replication initiator protein DnaA [Granulicatella seriolae]|uniref:Chromosomal replication initiator protein DnaA n=1 Tax=Granulicatella seriolae TaxID=2967226 RepID=A0ABT1WQH5_9LACT|nr:chromosomal replication initiator protein DnaA [Granulicatella seriolae]